MFNPCFAPLPPCFCFSFDDGNFISHFVVVKVLSAQQCNLSNGSEMCIAHQTTMNSLGDCTLPRLWTHQLGRSQLIIAQILGVVLSMR
eukprot:scaffold85434_cov36-Prasinocladus_malaysianus.AAC.1